MTKNSQNIVPTEQIQNKQLMKWCINSHQLPNQVDEHEQVLYAFLIWGMALMPCIRMKQFNVSKQERNKC